MQDVYIYDYAPLGGPWKVALTLIDPLHLYIVNTVTGEQVQMGLVTDGSFPKAEEEAQRRNSLNLDSLGRR